MSRADVAFPPAEIGLSFHVRLCDLDPVAPAELSCAFVEPLLAWLQRRNPHLDPHMCQSAVHEAIMSYVLRPTSYDPRRKDLASYLKMSASRDLLNLQRAERRHQAGRMGLTAVEDQAAVGKYEEDPAALVERDEDLGRWQAFLQEVRTTLTEEETAVLDLLLDGERSNEVCAQALGLGDRPRAERDGEVKRLKDRIKKRLERGGFSYA